MSFIVAKNLEKKYPMGKTFVHALKGADLSIRKGEYVCVAGPSGAGKSTLLNLLGLLDKPSSGELYIDDEPVHILNKRQAHKLRKNKIGFIFQSFNLVPVLSAYENIEFPMLIRKIDAAERKARIQAMAREVGIQEYLNHRPDELSGGQRQRVAIARALITRPEVVFADEPTANLDSKTGAAILDLMARLNQEDKTTFIIASHDSAIMSRANRVINVIDGVINE